MNGSQSNRAEVQRLLEEMVAEAQTLNAAAGGSVTDAVAAWLAPQYLLAARDALTASDAAERYKVLRNFVQDWALRRRGDHLAARLQLEREQFDWQRANHQAQKEQEFWQWLQRPEIREKVFPDTTRGISPAVREAIMRELNLL